MDRLRVGPVVTLVVAETGEVAHTLEELEDIIGRGLETFKEVGDALAQVRDGRLYLEHAETFEQYCSDRWGLKRQRAYELIDAAAIANAVSEISDTPPVARESHAKALAPLKDDPKTAAEAVRKANEATGGKPTAKAIADAVADEVAKQEQKAEDNAAIRDLNAKHQPEGFDEAQNQRDLEQRGRWSSNCREIAGLPGAAEFIARHRDLLTKRHIDQAERAYAWLDEFLLEYREAK